MPISRGLATTVGVLSVLASLLAALGACAATPQLADGTAVAVYAPAVRPGAAGRLIFLPESHSRTDARMSVRGAPLEEPDASPVEPTTTWLTGMWLIEATRDDLARERCNSDEPVAFDGRHVEVFRGQWSLAAEWPYLCRNHHGSVRKRWIRVASSDRPFETQHNTARRAG